jgi:hypothetical protein
MIILDYQCKQTLVIQEYKAPLNIMVYFHAWSDVQRKEIFPVLPAAQQSYFQLVI